MRACAGVLLGMEAFCCWFGMIYLCTKRKSEGQLHLCTQNNEGEEEEEKNLWWSCSHAEGCHSAYWLNHVSRELNITQSGGGWDGTSQITSSSSNCIIVACWLCGEKTATQARGTASTGEPDVRMSHRV